MALYGGFQNVPASWKAISCGEDIKMALTGWLDIYSLSKLLQTPTIHEESA